MEINTLTIKVKGKSKFSFLVHLLEQLGFVDIEVKSSVTKTSAKHDFFKSAGLWKDREINAQELREQAWNRRK